MDVTEFQAILTELFFGQLWFVPFLFIALICVVFVKIERYAAALIIPCLIAMEGLYYQHRDASGSTIWAMLATLLLMLFVAAMALLEKPDKK